ncbi:MAG: diguanylate cyclase domain-containing protein [Bryobacteraceae bacterium]
MISLRKSLSELDELAALFRVCLDCYLATLGDMDKFAVEVERAETARHRKALKLIRDRIESEPDASSLRSAKSAVHDELHQHRQRSQEAIRERELDVRQILTMLAQAAAAMTDRGDRYAAQFQGLAEDLESLSGVDNLGIIRRRLAQSVSNLKSCVNTMTEENRTSADDLHQELMAFRRRLAQAEIEAATDVLTGLANRREAERLIKAGITAGKPTCLMLFDLDGFKSVNDRYGHGVGDLVLKAFANRLAAQYRADDPVCRWGGDEFLVILTRALPDAVGRATVVASKLCGSYRVQTERGALTIQMSASVGVAQHQPGESGDDLLARADALLYRSKGIALAELPAPVARA